MSTSASRENLLTLQNFLGLNHESSQRILGSSILISLGSELKKTETFLKNILERTFENVHTSPRVGISYSCEVLTESDHRKTDGPFIFFGQNEAGALIISKALPDKKLSNDLHPFLYFLASCYAGGLVLKTVVGKLPFASQDEIVIEIDRLINIDLNSQVDIGLTHMAGAGAIGNSFLLALSTFSVSGELKIVDPDYVSHGNLNRCLFFGSDDIGQSKAEVLAAKAKTLFANLKLTPVPQELAKISDKSNGAWLRKLVVGVDSRRARRNLQSEIPKEVFDASTTGIFEVVIHQHERPLTGACLGCIYVKEKQEEAHEIHVAEALGVSLDHVKQLFIDREAALLILKKYPAIQQELIGLPYDTLFKQLCGEGKLVTNEGKQVLAPLAFVSALAGAYLALMFIEKHVSGQRYNYWKFSPWNNINFRLKQTLPSNPECDFCNDLSFTKIAGKLWNKSNDFDAGNEIAT